MTKSLALMSKGFCSACKRSRVYSAAKAAIRSLPASTITECKVLLGSLIEVKPPKVTKTMIVAYTLLSVLSNQSNIRWLDKAGAPP